jgi:hypothetical protein
MRAQNAANCAEVCWPAAVGVEHRFGLDVTVPFRHREGFDDQAGTQMLGGLPADHHAGSQIDDGGRSQPALTGAAIR